MCRRFVCPCPYAWSSSALKSELQSVAQLYGKERVTNASLLSKIRALRGNIEVKMSGMFFCFASPFRVLCVFCVSLFVHHAVVQLYVSKFHTQRSSDPWRRTK